MTIQHQADALTAARAQVTAEMREFFDALYHGADTGGLDAADLALIAARARAELLAPDEGAARVALSQTPRFSLAVAVNDDRPFLFDSAVLAAVAAGAQLRNVFHPVIEEGGRRRSLIVFVADPLTNEPARERLVSSLEDCFAAGAAAVRDWRAMTARLKSARDELAAGGPRGLDIEEDLAFLDWLADDHFTFLGSREYRLKDDGAHGQLEPVPNSGLGVLADARARVLDTGGLRENPGLSAEVRAYFDAGGPLIVTKSSARAQVHRRVHMDYVGIKIYDGGGRFAGEHRFVGLFTSGAYSINPREIPLLRRKIAAVTARAGLPPAMTARRWPISSTPSRATSCSR